ncbi:MAG: carbohydrate kinase [Lachnospiraceae bacterium]|nr:carbohydrate kinase [Lachnospiraceae bacterium]
MGKMYDVTSLGELLIDFTENGKSMQGNQLLEANPGGAPCNVLSMLQKMHHKTAFIGKVGKDIFGNLLEERVSVQGIATDGILKSDIVHTTLAFVHTKEDGDRDFSFYRKPGADIMLTEDDVISHRSLIENTRIFHFGSLSMTDRNVEKATKKAVAIAKENRKLISFDPNLRMPVWDSADIAKEKIAFGLKNCDILKISDDEITFISGTDDVEKGIKILLEKYQIPIVFATLGKSGSKAYYKEKEIFVPAFLNTKTIETTGAGDTFCGSILHFILQYGLEQLDEEKIKEMLIFANAAASIITTRKGALCVMPEEKEVYEFIQKRSDQ